MKIDLRQKYPLAGIVLYTFSMIYISYATFVLEINATTWNAIFWIILLFSSITALGKGFIQEENRSNYLYFLAPASHFLLARLIYHVVFQLILLLLTLLLFGLLLPAPFNPSTLFYANLLAGSIGMAGTFTLMSSLAARTQHATTTLAILSFPTIIPVLLLAISNSRKIILGSDISAISGNMLTLVSVNVIIIATSFILFPYSWRH